MKSSFYILFVLLLSFSFGNAQSAANAIEIETNKTVSISEDNVDVTSNTLNTNKEEVLLISADELKETIAKTASDIRTYFNRERNVDNIKLLFPKINKAKKA